MTASALSSPPSIRRASVVAGRRCGSTFGIWSLRMPNVEPHRLPATTLARLIEGGELSAEAVMSSCLERISEREPVVRAWVHLDPEQALAAARDCDRSGKKGVLK